MNILQKKTPSFLSTLKKRFHACNWKSEPALMLLLASLQAYQLKNGSCEKSLDLQGNIYLKIGQLKNSRKYLELAIKSFEKNAQNARNQKHYASMARTTFALAKITQTRTDWRRAYLYFQKAKKVTGILNDYCDFLLEFACLMSRPETLIQAVKEFKDSKHLILLYHKHYEMTLDPSSIVNGAFHLQQTKKDAESYFIWAEFLTTEAFLKDQPDKLLEALGKLDIALMEKKAPKFYEKSVSIACYHSLMTDSFDGILLARKSYGMLVQENPFCKGLLLLAEGSYFKEKEKISKAISSFEWQLHKNPTNPQIWQALAMSYFEEYLMSSDINFLEKAHFCFERHCLLKPYCLRARMDVAISSHFLAEKSQNISLLEKSVHLYEQVLQSASNVNQLNASMLLNYGKALVLFGEFTKDQAQYLRANLIFGGLVKTHPKQFEYRFALAKSLVYLGEMTNQALWFEEAIHHFQALNHLDPQQDQMLIEYSIALMNIYCLRDKISSLHLAQTYLKKALLLGNDEACYYLACNYSLLEDLQSAMHYLHQAKKRKILPDRIEMLQDSWLENLRELEAFKNL